MSPTPAGPGLVRRNQASRPEAPVTRLEASTEMAWPVGAVPRLTQSAGRAGTGAAGAPGTSPAVAAGGEVGDGDGTGVAATWLVTPQPSSAPCVAALTFGSFTN